MTARVLRGVAARPRTAGLSGTSWTGSLSAPKIAGSAVSSVTIQTLATRDEGHVLGKGPRGSSAKDREPSEPSGSEGPGDSGLRPREPREPCQEEGLYSQNHGASCEDLHGQLKSIDSIDCYTHL
jgi:hypothetical protein